MPKEKIRLNLIRKLGTGFRELIGDLLREAPFRTMVKRIVAVSPVSIRTKSLWDAVGRPNYLFGLLRAADEAILENVSEISAIEFGVANGNGLLILANHAAAVEKETGVKIKVFGFDTGGGYPPFGGDYRDQPDIQGPGYFPMDEVALRKKLRSNTTLIIGDVAKTVPEFISNRNNPAIGFIAVDICLYTAAREALKILSSPERRMLLKIPMFFRNIAGFHWHSFAGERLAISEFNKENFGVKIEQWHGVSYGRPFPEAHWLDRMYVAHNLEAISKVPNVLARVH